MSFKPSGGNVEVTGVLKVQVRKANFLKKINLKIRVYVHVGSKTLLIRNIQESDWCTTTCSSFFKITMSLKNSGTSFHSHLQNLRKHRQVEATMTVKETILTIRDCFIVSMRGKEIGKTSYSETCIMRTPLGPSLVST